MENFPETRSSLLLRLKDSKNHDAWIEFVDIYRPVIYAVAVKRGLQHADALDLVQAVLINVSNAIGKWVQSHPNARFRFWLLTVTRNATLNALKRIQRPEFTLGSQLGEVIAHELDGDDETERELESEYRKQLFVYAAQRVREQVDADTWQAFELTAIKGLSIVLAAQELGKQVGAIYAARSRVMKKLVLIVREAQGVDDEVQ